jgi:hypothetical protein
MSRGVGLASPAHLLAREILINLKKLMVFPAANFKKNKLKTIPENYYQSLESEAHDSSWLGTVTWQHLLAQLHHVHLFPWSRHQIAIHGQGLTQW